jgi:hypothetical protein
VLLKISSGQAKSSGQFRTLRLLPKGIWKNSEYKDPEEFYNLSNEGYNSEFWFQTKKLWLDETDNFQDMIILVGIDFDFLFGFNFRWLSGF